MNETIAEVHRILKPGGHFYFLEPNKDTWVNQLRKIWYKLDKKFTEDEEAISYKKTLKPLLSIGFEEKSLNYGGNIAYIIIGQSLILEFLNIQKISRTNIFFLERIFSNYLLCQNFFLSNLEKK